MSARPSKKARKAANDPNGLHAAADLANAEAGPSRQRLFQPFRTLGLVCDAVPFAMHVHLPSGALATPTVQIVTSVGRSWMMWDAGHMTLLFVGPEMGSPITSLAVVGNDVFAASGKRVCRYVRGREDGVFKAPGGVTLGKILIFGEQLLALQEDGKGLFVWNKATRELENHITFHSNFTATSLLHPATYLNKILVGSTSGEMQLWNIRTCSLIHSFPSSTPSSPSPITSLVQSPAIDVIGVGYLDGTIRIVDIRADELVMQLRMEEGSVTDLSFRMDGPPILASASSAGSIALWDLSQGGKSIHVQRSAHEQAIAGLQWVQGQPLLVSSSGDNSVKQWLFDSPTAVPRLLKYRGGHHAPPTLIRYYGEDGKQILTAGKDRALRYTSLVRDSRSHELSQGSSFIKKAIAMGTSAANLKLPPITALSSSSARSKDWEDILTAHSEDAIARTWSVQNKRIGAHTMETEQGIVQSVCVTACGNFGLAGSSNGEIRMWNMQSGKERRSFALDGLVRGDSKSKIINRGKVKPKSAAERAAKSVQAVTGIVTDTLNTVVVAGTLEGKLYFFDFHTTKLLHTLQLPSSITALSLNRDSGLLSAICDDLAVRLVDIEARRVVREFRGFRGRILDTAFSPDSRWLVATSLDSTIRTFDIPTGRLVDAFKTPSIATSVTFSPTGDFLATSHVDSVGVHLWANRAQFADVSLRHINEDEEVPEVGMPSVRGDEDADDIEGLEDVGAPEYRDIYTTPEQLSDGLLTLSLIPRSRWQTLLNLDTIRQRNKPKEPPKAPEAAPFFLPTVAGVEARFDLSAASHDESKENSRPTLEPISAFAESDFTRRLTAENEDGDYTAFFEYLKALSPSATDLEIRSLISLDHLGLFLHALTQRLSSHRDFEAVQAYLSVFLSVHGDVLVANPELADALEEMRRTQRKESKRVMELTQYALGTLAFLRSTG